MEKIGLIAGRGNFPLLFAQQAKKKGFFVSVVAVRNNTKRQIKDYADRLSWISVPEFKRIADIFKADGISKAAMCGQINPYLLFDPKVMSHPDVLEFFGRIEDRRADTVFKTFSDRLRESGLELLDSTFFLGDYMPQEGALSPRYPSEAEYKDIRFGFKLAKHLGQMDIGQSVCVKDGVVLAVESIEGTDNTIRRARSFSRGGPIVLVKVSKPSQDMRFDVPVAGLKTVKNLPCGSCLAIEAGKTLFLERDQALHLAARKKIAIISVGIASLTPFARNDKAT